MILELEPGQEIVLTADPRTDHIWLQLNANRGSLGLKLTRRDAVALRRALFDAIYNKN